MTVLILEDNENVREAAAGYLKLDGFEVCEYGLIAQAETQLSDPAKRPDLALLDVMLPDGDGFMLAKRLRSIPGFAVPIIFLTARDGESDRITGFELGADDYVVKPFSPKELVLRVKAVLRRKQEADTQSRQAEDRGGIADGLSGNEAGLSGKGIICSLGASVLELREDEHSLYLDGQDVRLTAAEWNILAFLIAWPHQVFSRLKILETCLESIAENSERTVDTHIKNIRKKIGESWIETVRAFGYRFAGKRR